MERREFIQKGSGAGALAVAASWLPQAASAQNVQGWNKSAFETKSLADAVKALGGVSAAESKDVALQAPEIAENGNVVRIGAQSSIAGTNQIGFLVEKNPTARSAVFDIPAGTDASVATNVKLGQSSNVYALARVGDRFFYAVKEVKVTLGGCGG